MAGSQPRLYGVRAPEVLVSTSIMPGCGIFYTGEDPSHARSRESFKSAKTGRYKIWWVSVPFEAIAQGPHQGALGC